MGFTQDDTQHNFCTMPRVRNRHTLLDHKFIFGNECEKSEKKPNIIVELILILR